MTLYFNNNVDISKLHIVTVATESKYYFPYLQESCRRNGKELEVLGMGEKWEGFNWKFKKMIDYLEGLPQDDIVCFVDGYDVLCVRDLHELIPSFFEIEEREGCKMVVAEDKLTWINKFAVELYFGKCKNMSINSGTYIGTAINLLKIIKKIYKINPNNDADDQFLMTTYCNYNPNDVYIDANNYFFVVLSDANSFNKNLCAYISFEHNNKITYKNKSPFFLHAPGSGNLDDIVKKLGYDENCNIFESDNTYNPFYKYSFSYKNKFAVFFVFTIIIIIVVVIIFLYSLYISMNGKNKKIFF